jgi:hypothetical protein
MSAIITVPIYLRVSKTLAERVKRSDADAETLLRIGLLVHAMPDGATINRKRGEILGLAAPDETTRPHDTSHEEVEF